MSLKILIDMNLSPAWVPLLENAGWTAVHWSAVGDPKATDRAIMDWAKAKGYVVVTYDLDFATILALTHNSGPSVVQMRGGAALPGCMSTPLIAAIGQHESDLNAGALVVVEGDRCRARILPI